MDKRESAVKTVLVHFLRTTTLHGFKYLCSKYKIDRIAWLVCCVASGCCAGTLCAVLWTRFLDVPAILQMRDMRANVTFLQFMPLLISVYPPMHSLTGFFRQLNMNESMINRLTRTVENVLAGRNTAEDQLKTLEQLLSAQNTTLSEMMFKYSPACEDLILSCRWQGIAVPCEVLFKKELMIGGVCCTMRPDKAYQRLFNASHQPKTHYQQVKTIELSLQCSNETIYGCMFFAKYNGEPNVQNIVLAPGYIYFAQMLFNSVPMSSAGEFLESDCVGEEKYSREICLVKCSEKYCGCLDPLREIDVEEEGYLPLCSVTQLECLRTFNEQANFTCGCSPSCNQITSDINLESTKMNLGVFTTDPLYNGLNLKSTVIHLRLSLPLSKIFTLNPTETWLTLLSSLGGVFNMFLGVGLFSALEILFLLFLKLPYALIKPQLN